MMKVADLYRLMSGIRPVLLRNTHTKKSLLSPVCKTCQSSTRNYSATKDPFPKPDKKAFSGSLITWRSVAGVAIVGSAALFGLKLMRDEKDKALMKNKQVMVGKAAIGGEWSLIDHHGDVRSSQDFLGQWVILYFGFSFCPDICPEQMEKLVEAVDRIDNDRQLPSIVPIFVTLDPERDDPSQLSRYIKEFSPKIIGMTGTKAQVAAAAKAYRIYFSAGPKDEDNDYIVDHSIIKYLVKPDGEFAEYFGQNKTAGEVYRGCKDHMLEWKQQHGHFHLPDSQAKSAEK